MKISLNWLKEYVDLNGISVEDIVANLTMSGLEVEEVIDENEIYKNFIVGFVKEKVKHPNADKLSLCTVSDGKKDYQVICGAPNVDAGQKVVFAKVGAVVPKGNFKIGKAKIRGIESFGMICAEDELELSDNHDGIMVLDAEQQEGTPISEALGLNDVVMEIAITPNRPDALSHFGAARDLAAIFNRELHLPEINFVESSENIEDLASIEINDEINCPRYTAKIVKNITVKESPEWLKNRLIAIGLRPINNIVDVTNFVMYETGQPLHAFDLNKLANNKIVVRTAEAEEKFTTLDSKERKLPSGALMICDADKAVAVAGVMGGENSEISNESKNILIESAYFNPSSIRKTSKQLGLSTEASYRFERGCDPNGTLYSASRAAQLICNVADGEVAKGSLDAYPKQIEKKEVRIRFARIKKILGYDISSEKIIQLLKDLGLQIVFESEEELHLTVPTFRPDIEREIDIIEEIARINGYDNIPTVSKISITLDQKHDDSEFVDDLRKYATSLGFFEMINNPLVSDKHVSIIGNRIPVLNPQSIDMAFLRTSLVPGALSIISDNINIGEKDLNLFEIGNVFNKKSDGEISSFDDFTEDSKALFIITGKRTEKQWNQGENNNDVYTLKGYIDSFLEKNLLDNALNDSYYHDEDSLYDFYFTKIYKNSTVGKGGRVRKDVLKKFDIQQDVFCFEFDIALLKNVDKNKKQYIAPLKFPKVNRDFAFIFDKQITFGEVQKFIKQNATKLLKSVSLFDLFESDTLGNNKKSMAFSLEYYSEDRTLTEEEVEKDFNSLINAVTKEFNAKLRGN